MEPDELISSRPKKPRSPRVTPAQISMLIHHMSTHTDFAAGRLSGPNGAELMDQQWARLKNNLNAIGPFKTVDQWRATWRDLKCAVRHKSAELKKSRIERRNSAGVKPLKSWEKEILEIISRTSTDSLPNINDVGIPQPSPPGSPASTDRVMGRFVPEELVQVELINVGGVGTPTSYPVSDSDSDPSSQRYLKRPNEDQDASGVKCKTKKRQKSASIEFSKVASKFEAIQDTNSRANLEIANGIKDIAVGIKDISKSMDEMAKAMARQAFAFESIASFMIK